MQTEKLSFGSINVRHRAQMKWLKRNKGNKEKYRWIKRTDHSLFPANNSEPTQTFEAILSRIVCERAADIIIHPISVNYVRCYLCFNKEAHEFYPQPTSETLTFTSTFFPPIMHSVCTYLKAVTIYHTLTSNVSRGHMPSTFCLKAADMSLRLIRRNKSHWSFFFYLHHFPFTNSVFS